MIYKHDEYRKVKNYQKPGSSLHHVREMNKLEHLSNLAESCGTKKASDIVENTTMERMAKSAEKKTAEIKKVNAVAKKTKDLEEAYLMNTISEIFMDSLPLDEEFKEEHKQSLKRVFCKEMAQLAETPDALLKQMSVSESYYLRDLSESIKKKAAKDANDIANNDKCDEECKKSKVKHSDTAEAVDTIKNKVLKTIKKENALSKKGKEVQEDLAKAQQVNESARAIYKTKNVKSYSLFKSLMINSYKSSLNKALNESTSVEGNATMVNGSVKVDTDKILAESIIKYTVLETFNTLQLKKFTPKSVIEMSNRLAYKRF